MNLEKGSRICRSYQLKFGYDAFNPGGGDTRFAPLEIVDGPIPTMYAADNDEAALLESVFHDVHQAVGDKVIYESVVRGWGIAYVVTPIDRVLVDLRDGALVEAGMTREQIVSTTAEHYPCTREWAQLIHDEQWNGHDVAGIVWNSRQAELSATPIAGSEVVLLFGDRAPAGAGSYELTGAGVRNMTEGAGLLLLEKLASSLGARVEPAS